MPMWLNWQSS